LAFKPQQELRKIEILSLLQSLQRILQQTLS